MTTESLLLPLANVPAQWRQDVELLLTADEKVIAWLELDLDVSLHFSRGLVLATDRRLLARMAGDEGWQAWSYAAASGFDAP